jgi:hypothetical protein
MSPALATQSGGLTEEELKRLPASVRRQHEEAMAQMEQAQTPEAANEAPPAEGNGNEAPASEDEGQPIVPAAQPANEAPGGSTDGALAAEKAEMERQIQELTAYQQRHEGRLRKLSQENRELAERLKTATETIADLERKATPTRKGQLPVHDLEDYGLVDDERQVLGAEGMSGVAKIAAKISQEQVGRTSQQVTEMSLRLEEQLKTLFFQGLTARVPNWQAIDQTDAFDLWLEAIEPASGQSRRALIEHCWQTKDTERAAWFYRAFEDEQQSKQIKPKPAATPARVAPVEEQVVPRKGVGVQTPAARIWTAKEIQQTATDINRGRYSASESDALRKEMDLAISQGRVRP